MGKKNNVIHHEATYSSMAGKFNQIGKMLTKILRRKLKHAFFKAKSAADCSASFFFLQISETTVNSGSSNRHRNRKGPF
jgi:hypothetical protein